MQRPLKVNEILCRIVLLNGLHGYQEVRENKKATSKHQGDYSMKRHYTIIKLFINLIIFGFALSFEGASPERTALLVMFFAAFAAWGLLRPRLKTDGGFWYAVDAVLIFLLEYQSKYLVNYFFHILYISAMVEAGISQDRRKGNIAAVILSVAALSKYIYALSFGVSASILSQLLFNLFALIFLITLINFGKLQQEERDKSQKLYRELVEAYHRLEELSVQKERAAALEERNRIARDMHDSLGHRLTSLIMQIEMGKEYLKKEPDKTDEYLDRCAGNAREALTDTRQALRALGGMGSGGAGGVTGNRNSRAGSVTGRGSDRTDSTIDRENGIAYGMESIIYMVEEFSRNTGIEINYKLPGQSIETGAGLEAKTSPRKKRDIGSGQVTGPGTDLGPEVKTSPDQKRGVNSEQGTVQEKGLRPDAGLDPQETKVLYRVIQEAITNATRHGRATRIDIDVRRDGDGVWFCIQDNGAAGSKYTEGFGLGNMRKRLEDMGGSLEIKSGQGFKLTGRFKATYREL